MVRIRTCSSHLPQARRGGRVCAFRRGDRPSAAPCRTRSTRWWSPCPAGTVGPDGVMVLALSELSCGTTGYPTVTLGAPTCDSLDVITRAHPMPPPSLGEVVVVPGEGVDGRHLVTVQRHSANPRRDVCRREVAPRTVANGSRRDGPRDHREGKRTRPVPSRSEGRVTRRLASGAHGDVR